jgi:hypothetical protein
MDKTDHLMAEKNGNNKDSQKGQVAPKNIKKSVICSSVAKSCVPQKVLNISYKKLPKKVDEINFCLLAPFFQKVGCKNRYIRITSEAALI